MKASLALIGGLAGFICVVSIAIAITFITNGSDNAPLGFWLSAIAGFLFGLPIGLLSFIATAIGYQAKIAPLSNTNKRNKAEKKLGLTIVAIVFLCASSCFGVIYHYMVPPSNALLIARYKNNAGEFNKLVQTYVNGHQIVDQNDFPRISQAIGLPVRTADTNKEGELWLYCWMGFDCIKGLAYLPQPPTVKKPTLDEGFHFPKKETRSPPLAAIGTLRF